MEEGSNDQIQWRSELTELIQNLKIFNSNHISITIQTRLNHYHKWFEEAFGEIGNKEF